MKNSLLTVIILSLFGCSKSEEKLIAGVWDVQQLLINGNDSTDAVRSQVCYSPMKFLTDKEKADHAANILGGEPQDSGCDARGTYELNDQTLILRVGSINFRPVSAFWYVDQGSTKITWNIIKLNKKELQLETNHNGDLNRLNLIKQ